MSTADTPLPAELRARIADLARAEHRPRAASVSALTMVQERFGWVSDAHLAETASLLGMSPADLDGIATYFNLIFRRPVGRHVIMLCDSVSCWIMGRDTVCARLQARLGIRPGETTPDGAVTLLPIVCLGHCDHAPAMLVDRTLHGDLDAETAERLADGLRGAAS
ncbi:NADH-quinone oxidoreductase subunit E [Gluconacetobacter liquefaciens]|uniref:NADH dehydrogenase subunit E n=1 Tax=Gluconacetobacter liquefaciens TaxID=89584 RepID=A0A370FZM3_GLULI|nr:NADH-quinone oxidoreductase subunit NuoE [Gluconacetobacter liquefaciens]MBB2187129.1 NADH-quinone oxidoreductase subunit NuoE [Gluconacetobacter liquefaciens]RDI37107.1 NADH dehydrogenase subunit E [Gluconacetobacter liquefaciens]GEB37854.1 NADH-quinone oxidoreductase subunit E [Gluconacetobacter liquefaciens]